LVSEWTRLGKPTVAVGGASGIATVPHPLVALIRDSRKDLEFYAKRLRPGVHGGVSPAAVPGIEPSPAQRLRAVDK